MKKLRLHPLWISMVLVLVFSLNAGVKIGTYSTDGEKLIEVCKYGIVKVPPGTKYVRCMGEVRKVLRITPYMREDDSCICPKCCDGECAVIVVCTDTSSSAYDGKWEDLREVDIDSLLDQGVGLCTMWLACD